VVQEGRGGGGADMRVIIADMRVIRETKEIGAGVNHEQHPNNGIWGQGRPTNTALDTWVTHHIWLVVRSLTRPTET
jgi:hypothetical protein